MSQGATEYTSENILNRQFTASHSNKKWLTDIEDFKYGDGHKA